MSDTLIRYVPADPDAVLAPSRVEAALALLRAHAGGAAVRLRQFEHPAFADCGELLETIRCPHCGSEIETEAWQEAMDRAYESRFHDRTFTVPCCNRPADLNDLAYDWPCAFGSWWVELLNPPPLPDGLAYDLALTLGTVLRRIHVRY